MNPVNQAQMKRFVDLHGGAGYSETELFEVYSIFLVLSGLLSENADPFDVHLKGSEFGLDGVAILIQGTVITTVEEVNDILAEVKNPLVEFIFFQSKTSTKFEYGDISKFADAIQGFFDGSMVGESAQLDELIAAKDAIYASAGGRRNPGVKAYFNSLGTYSAPQRTEKLISSTRTKLKNLNIFDPDSLEFNMVGAAALQRYFRGATSAVEVKFSFPRNVVMPQNDSVDEGYIGYVSANEVLKLVASYDDQGNVVDINSSVFFDNIRDFNESSDINQKIIATLSAGEGKDFAFRNNGITVVAKLIHRTGDDFRIEDYQIVNGCQTSNIIFHSRNEINGVNVPLRLIGSKDDNFISSIIVGTNRQNQVREEQFWALRPFMKNFEEYCQSADDEDRLYFERRENQFRGQGMEKVRIVQPSVLMKVVTATILGQPNRSSRDYRRIYQDNKERLFLDEHDVRVYYAASYLNYRLDFLWRNQRLSPDYKLFRYYILYALSSVAAQGVNVLAMKKGDAETYASRLILLAKDESKLKIAIKAVATNLKKQIDPSAQSSREKIRDAIRSDSFLSGFSFANVVV